MSWECKSMKGNKAKQIAKMIRDYAGFDIEEAYRCNGVAAVVDYADKLLRPFWDFEKGCFSDAKAGWEYCSKLFGWLHLYLLCDSAPTTFKDLQVYRKHFEDNFTGFLW